jgi:hypothetical protein
MKRLTLFFAIAGLFALAACNPIMGDVGLGECSASNCPPPNSCQVPNQEGIFDGIPVCTAPNGTVVGSVDALPVRHG